HARLTPSDAGHGGRDNGQGGPLVLLQREVSDGHDADRDAVPDDRDAAHGALADQPFGLFDVIIGTEHGQPGAADVANAGGLRVAAFSQDPDGDVPFGDEPGELA